VYLHTLRHSTTHVEKVLIAYELSDLLILGLFGFLFRPREHSPFFLMVPATIQDDRTRSLSLSLSPSQPRRPIPMIEGTDDEEHQSEVELHPLLHPRESQGHEQDNPINQVRLLFLRNPNQTVNVAISPFPARLLGGPSPAHQSRRGVAPSTAAVAPVGGLVGPGIGAGGAGGGGSMELVLSRSRA
jgi:hypothetical protein